jgi:hypothetical protein
MDETCGARKALATRTPQRFPVVCSVRLQADRERPAEAGHYVLPVTQPDDTRNDVERRR